MLIEFSVENYLSFRERQTLSFEAAPDIHHLSDYYVEEVNGRRILKVGLILGANASGKSNVLKALNYLRQLMIAPLASKSESTGCVPFLLDEESKDRDTTFEISFVSSDHTYYYRIVLNSQYIREEVLKDSVNGNVLLWRTTDPEKQIAIVHSGESNPMPEESLKALNLNTLWNNTMIGGYLKTNIECQPLREVHKWMKGYLHHLILPKENLTQYISNKIYQGCIDKDVMVPLLQQADFNVSDIEVSRLGEGQYDVRLSHQGKALPFKLESLGTQRYYGLAGLLYLMIKEPSAFMIDELDESLHPDLYQHLLLAFCVNAHGSQLIASTHNRELLSNSDVYRNDMIHFTNRSEDSTTQLYRLSDFDRDLDFATEDILSIYNAGRFGAVPILGDYWTSKYLSKTSAISE